MASGYYDGPTAGTPGISASAKDYWSKQSCMVYASAATRAADGALTAVLREGMISTQSDTDRVYRYDGAAWRIIGGPPPRVSVTRSTAQTISNNTNSVVTFDTERFDSDTIHDTVTNSSRFTIPTGMGGLWHAGYNLSGTLLGATGGAVWIQVNGVVGTRYANAVALSGTNATASDIIVVAAGDYIEVGCYENAGASATIAASTSDNFWAMYIGPT